MPGQDRRVRRSQRLLRDALVVLIREKDYDRITVQDILDRADVGRSTFYTHYRDKDDLLLAGFDDLRTGLKRDLDALKPGVPAHPTSPTGVIFAHAYQHRDLYRALCGRRGGTVVQRHLHRLVSDLLRDHLRPHIEAAGSDLPVDIAAAFYTAAVLGLLTWWVDQDFQPGPAALAGIYQQLAAPGLLAALTPRTSEPPPSPRREVRPRPNRTATPAAPDTARTARTIRRWARPIIGALPGEPARVSEPLEHARSAIHRTHQAAVRYRDDSLHQAARDITLAAKAMGYELGPVEEYRPCPVCGAEPGALCIRTPGHDTVNGAHPERSQDDNT